MARECVEALRFGTPIVVPAGSGPAAAHAGASGGATYTDEWELLEAAGTYLSEASRSSAAVRAREYADANYGDPAALVRRLEPLLSGAADPR